MTANRRSWGRGTRQHDADRRAATRAALTDGEQWQRLVDRGHGHCDEAHRLLNGGGR